MEQSSQQPQPMMGAAPDGAQIAYGSNPYTPPMINGAPAVIGAFPCTQPSPGASHYQQPAQHQLSYQQVQQLHHQQQQQQQQEQLQTFWANQMHEIAQTTDFKNHSLPLARIKKIMKADEDVRMISAEAPVIFAKACEMFILELTLRSWLHTEESKRRTLQKNDIAAAITRTDIFDFLVDIVPRDDDPNDDELGIAGAAHSGIGAPPDSIPYYVVPTQPPGGAGAELVMGKAIDLTTPVVPTMYAAGPQVHPMAYFWQQQQQPMPEGE